MGDKRKTISVAICAVGFKGQRFVEHALKRWQVSAVFTYEQPNVLENSAAAIRSLCAQAHVTCIDSKYPDFAGVNFDLCFLVGWQFLVEADERFVVFHDSLLPRQRGFSPTVWSLLAGEKQIGLSALLPVGEMDSGPVLGQEAIPITYPITLASAFEVLTQGYIRLADRLIDTVREKPLRSIAVAQDESKATYSLWRDREDQRIDWTHDSESIQRLVNAVSWPYTGAYAFCDGQEIIVHEVAVMPDIAFEVRHPGKCWGVADNQPLVVCGRGMVKILRATLPDGKPAPFTRFRARFT